MTPRAPALAPDERRRAIIDATKPLLLEHGLGVSTKQIAQACGIAEGTIFRVFDSKDHVLFAVIDDALDPAASCVRLAAIDRSLPLEERLVAAFGVLQDGIREVSQLFAALHVPAPDGQRREPPHPHKPTQDVHEHRAQVLAAALIDVLADDADRLTVAPEEAASLLRGVAFATAHPLFSDRVLTDPATVVRVLAHGLIKDHRPC